MAVLNAMPVAVGQTDFLTYLCGNQQGGVHWEREKKSYLNIENAQSSAWM